jgi:ketosteroid isomerase-like protein
LETDLAKKILSLETNFWKAIKDKDVETALRLTADPCIVAGPQGVSRIDKETFGKLMATAQWTLHEFEIREAQVQLLGDDVAVIGYRVHEKLTVDGAPVTLDAADASTWVKKDGRWVCALHTESLAGDPYGRDRQRRN